MLATPEVFGSPPLAGPPGVANVAEPGVEWEFDTPIEVVPRALQPALRVDLRAGFLFVEQPVKKGTNHERE
jgi:hypothetical protein